MSKNITIKDPSAPLSKSQRYWICRMMRQVDWQSLEKRPAQLARLNQLNVVDESGNWPVVSSLTKGQAAALLDYLFGLKGKQDNAGVTVTHAEPTPAKSHRKVTLPEEVKPVSFNDGDLIIVAGETRRISVNGNRAYLARV